VKGFDDHLDNYGDPNPAGDTGDYEPCDECGFFSCLCHGDRLPAVTPEEEAEDQVDDTPDMPRLRKTLQPNPSLWEDDEPQPDNDNLIREGIYAAGDNGNPDDHPPTYDEDPSFYDDEPPFDENHYRYHTPAGSNPDCDNCKWLNWHQPFSVPGHRITPEDDDERLAAGADQADYFEEVNWGPNGNGYDDGITTDDFDNWPTGREFPS
jgi:hypothetical protein